MSRTMAYADPPYLGLTEDDDLVDVFPGSGAVGQAWESWRAQTRLAV